MKIELITENWQDGRSIELYFRTDAEQFCIRYTWPVGKGVSENQINFHKEASLAYAVFHLTKSLLAARQISQFTELLGEIGELVKQEQARRERAFADFKSAWQARRRMYGEIGAHIEKQIEGAQKQSAAEIEALANKKYDALKKDLAELIRREIDLTLKERAALLRPVSAAARKSE